jgi:hypothetical protein
MVKDPKLQFKYARGLGDLVACVLHSKLLGWLTHLITGKKEPCSMCKSRQEALNVLVPIPFWKFFFKNHVDFIESLNVALKKAGYATVISPDKTYIKAAQSKFKPLPSNPPLQIPSSYNESIDTKLQNYTLISTSENEVDNILIRIQTFKLKS